MSMRLFSLIIFAAFAFSMNAYSQTQKDFASTWEKEHVSKLFPSDVRHSDLKKYLQQLTKLGLSVKEVGRSVANREIYQVEWGKGPIKVFMWSQMHGDEPTATSALIDMFAMLQKKHGEAWVKTMESAVTIHAVPMLNPDGQEMFQRRNMQGIDINRDALDLRSPEARLLKQLRDDWNPVIGFNLHNQGALTTVGRTPNQAAISLLVVYGDEAKTANYGQERNLRLTSAIVNALRQFIPGHIARYSDEWAPTAFGDNFSAWGTPTILIETGALHPHDEMFLVKMNFVAFLTALQALASGSERTQDTTPYLSLPLNSSGGIYNTIFRRANILNRPGTGVTTNGDIAVSTERSRASFAALNFIKIIGNLTNSHGLEEYDVSDLILVQRLGSCRVGELGEFLFYRKDRVVDWTAADLEMAYPPDAIFSGGKWVKGGKLFSKK